MDVIWHGHSCFEVRGSTNTVVFDPHDGKSIGIKPPQCSADIVLISHQHYDHNMARVIKGNHKDLIETVGVSEINGLKITGFPCHHDAVGGSKRGDVVIYMFEMDGITLCHCGDMGNLPSQDVMDALTGKIDIMFVPVGEFYTISLDRLETFIDATMPKIIVPMHYKVGGVTLPISPLDNFTSRVDSDLIIYVGNRVELTSEDIPEFTGCWVFDR